MAASKHTRRTGQIVWTTLTILFLIAIAGGLEKNRSRELHERYVAIEMDALHSRLHEHEFDRVREDLAGLVGLDFIQKTVLGMLPPDNPEVMAALSSIRAASNATIVYLLDSRGTTVACTPYEGNHTLTGENYAFRPYFKQPMQSGTPSFYGALGVTTHRRGIYIGVPIVIGGIDTAIGVAVAKTELTTLDYDLQQRAFPAALVSAQGVVFASNQPEWLYTTVFPLSPQTRDSLQLTMQFGSKPLQPSGLDLLGTLVRIERQRYIPLRRVVMDGSWYLIGLFKPQMFNILYFASVFLVLIAVWAVLSAVFHFYISLRRSEFRFRTLFEKSVGAYLLIEKDGTLIDCNQAAADLLHICRHDVAGRKILEFAPPDQANGTPSDQYVARHIEETLSQGQSKFEWTLQRFDGSLLRIEVIMVLLEIDGAQTLFTSWYVIEEFKRAQEKLGQVLTETEKMNKLMIGREARIVEMKREVNALLAELGRDARYRSVL